MRPWTTKLLILTCLGFSMGPVSDAAAKAPPPVVTPAPMCTPSFFIPDPGPTASATVNDVLGNYLIYDVWDPSVGGTLWVHEIDTGVQRQLTWTTGYDAGARVVPGYDALVFQRRQGAWSGNYVLGFGPDTVPGTGDDVLTLLDTTWSTSHPNYFSAPMPGMAGDLVWANGDPGLAQSELHWCDLNPNTSTPCNTTGFGIHPAINPANWVGWVYPAWPGLALYRSYDPVQNTTEMRGVDLASGVDWLWFVPGNNDVPTDVWGPYAVFDQWPTSTDLVATFSNPVSVLYSGSTGLPGYYEQGGRLARNPGASDGKLKMVRTVSTTGGNWLYVADPLDPAPTTLGVNTQISAGWGMAIDGDVVAYGVGNGIQGMVCTIP